MSVDPLDCGLAELRQRTSIKWTQHPPEVLPLWIAEMDAHVCPAVQSALSMAVTNGDTGYAGCLTEQVAKALSRFSETRWDWAFPTSHVAAFSDIGMAVRSYLKALINPGDAVIITPPVYQSFYFWFNTAGVKTLEVPLLDVPQGGRMDFDGLEQAFAGGAKVMVLCSPHNPLGTVHSRADLTRLADLAEQYDVTIISDEIHAPLTYKDSTFVPYQTISEHAAKTAITVTSTSKGWNLAGLKAAFAITARQDLLTEDDQMEAYWGIGHFGLLAAKAAFADDLTWINSVIASVEDRAAYLGELLAEHLPLVPYRTPDASYLAWLDLRPYELGDKPAEFFLQNANVALNEGLGFGTGGAGHLRLNFGTSREVLELAVTQLGEAIRRR